MKPKRIEVSKNGGGKVVLVVAGIEPGEPRFVGEDGKLYESCKDPNVIHISVVASVNAELAKYGITDMYDFYPPPIKTFTVDENRRVESLD